jgi:hypothetical protein
MLSEGGRSWLIAMGVIPYALYGMGLAMALSAPAFFWEGIVLTAAAVVWLFWDWLKYQQRLLPLLVVIGLGWFVEHLATKPAPLETAIRTYDSDYPPDTEIGGIKWQPVFYDLRLELTNLSDEIYSDLTVRIRTDLVIPEAAAIANFSHCEAGPITPVTADVQFESGGRKGEIPHGAKGVKTLLSPVYKIHCDRLFALDNLELVVPLIKYDLKRSSEQTAPRTKPSWVTAIIDYYGVGRFRTAYFQQCLIGDCREMKMPTDLSGVVLLQFPPIAGPNK